ncbi:hypothetical protein Hypma_003504 [Hypsizygus marmoreus]|uniref:F-box domain-containing protein n=1 Tax=Hypsizygus marmoreus TaxID=39966 RepID=A0A369JAP3_HYPMA|nr:hypothetical protein Hypma_003504 [Hypsizygus marmoreus]
MSMNSTNIPQDVINCILDLLKDDSHTLSTCALVAHSFRSLSQKYLFTRITVNLSSDQRCAPRIQELHDLLTTNCSLAGNIHNLTIVLPFNSFEALPTLRMLSQLHKLTISSTDSLGQDRPCWHDVGEEMRTFIYTLLRSPYLVDISLQLIQDFPFWYLTHCAQLKRIYLGDLIPSDDQDPAIPLITTTESPGSGRLEQLSLLTAETAMAFIDVASHPGCRIDIRHLHELTLLDVDPTTGRRLFDGCAQSLQSLTIKLQAPYDDLVLPWLNPMTTKDLRSLCVAFDGWDPYALVNWMRSFLDNDTHIAQGRKLEKLIIRGLTGHPSGIWQFLDYELSNAACLSTVHVCFDFQRYCAGSASVMAYMQSLQLLPKRGNVSVEWIGQDPEPDQPKKMYIRQGQRTAFPLRKAGLLSHAMKLPSNMRFSTVVAFFSLAITFTAQASHSRISPCDFLTAIRTELDVRSALGAMTPPSPPPSPPPNPNGRNYQSERERLQYDRRRRPTALKSGTCEGGGYSVASESTCAKVEGRGWKMFAGGPCFGPWDGNGSSDLGGNGVTDGTQEWFWESSSL